MLRRPALLLALSLGCASAEAPPPGRAPVPATVRVDPPPPVPVTASSEPPFVDLEVPGFRAALVSVPADTSPRPLLVATHGAGGAPESYCKVFKALLDDSAFIVCPRGKPLNALLPEGESGYYYPDHPALEREVLASLDAARARFGARIDAARPVYFGFSQGATMGALVLSRMRFTRAILAEGGFSEWTIPSAKDFKASGGERVLFACGGAHCSVPAKKSAAFLERAGIAARVVGSDAAGHTFGGAVGAAVCAALPWVLEADDRFRFAPCES